MPDTANTTLIIVALIAILPTTIASISALVVSLSNSRNVKAVDAKSDKIIEKTVEIHALANSTLSNMTEQRNLMAERVDGLERMIRQLTTDKVTADRVAETTATQSAVALTEAQHAPILSPPDTKMTLIDPNKPKRARWWYF